MLPFFCNVSNGYSMRLKFLSFPFLTILFAASCSNPKDLVYQQVNNVHVNRLGFKESMVGLNVVYYNPNKYGLKAKGGDIDVFMNDKYLGKANIETATDIPKLDTFSVPVSVTLNMQSLLQNSFQFLQSSDVTIRLKGYVKVGKAGVFINVPVDCITKEKIQLK